MWDRPDFLDLPARPGKPRVDGLTHVLDKGVPIPALDGVLAQAGELIDVLKIGWGIAYVDRTLKQRIALCDAAGILVSLGGTLLEVAANCGRVEELRRWALEQGLGAVEAIANHVPLDRVIFEAPLKAQQAWFIRFLGPGVNLGNVPPEEMLPLETLRLGLRADTAPTRMLR